MVLNILDKLQKFQEQDFNKSSVSIVKNELHEFYNIYSTVVANLGNCVVYRVRKIEKDEPHLLLKDVWCPPASTVRKLGRANNIGEVVFYGALDYESSIKEVGIEIGDEFSLALYYLLERDIYNKSSIVIRPYLNYSSDKNDVEILGCKLSDFMVREFTQVVNVGEEYKYTRSCAIASILFDIPNKDSILYPSVKQNDSVNIVMKEVDAKKRLLLNTVLTCKCISIDNYIVLNVKQVTKDQKLRVIYDYSDDPIPLKVKSIKMNFSTIFGDNNIPTPQKELEDILNVIKK